MKGNKNLATSTIKIDKIYFESLKKMSKPIVIMDINKESVLYVNKSAKKLTKKEFGNESAKNILKIKNELTKINKFTAEKENCNVCYSINKNYYNIIWKNIKIDNSKVVLVQVEDMTEEVKNKIRLEQLMETNEHVKMAIEGVVGLIKSSYEEIDGDKEYLNRLEEGCNYMKMLIENEINIKESNNRDNIINNEIINLNGWLESYINATEKSIKSKNVELVFENRIRNGLYAIDKIKLGRIIGIIINNSLKRSIVDGKVIVLKAITYTQTPSESILAIELKDNAVNIDDYVMKYINSEKQDEALTYDKLKKAYDVKVIKKIVQTMNGKIKIIKKGNSARIRVMIKCAKVSLNNTDKDSIENNEDYSNKNILQKLA